MAVWVRFYFTISQKETQWSKGASQGYSGRSKVGCFIQVYVFKHLLRGCSKMWEDEPYQSFTGRFEVVYSEDRQLEQSPLVRRKMLSERTLLTMEHDNQWHTAKTGILLPKRQLLELFSLQNVEQLELKTRLPDHIRLLPQTSWGLASLTMCHRMTLRKEKSTCLSKGSLRRK